MAARLSAVIKLCEPHRPPAPTSDPPSPRVSASPASSTPSNDHLKVTLPTFDGQLHNWRAFWDCFNSLMESNSHLTPQKKRTFLVKAMDSPEAKARAQQVLACTASYEDAVAKMRYTYEDNIELHRHHVSQIFQATPYQNTKASLSSLLGLLEENTAGMRATNGYTAEQIVASHVFSLLPLVMQSKWKERVGKSPRPPTQTQLEDFLKDMIHASTDAIPAFTYGEQVLVETHSPPVQSSNASRAQGKPSSTPRKPTKCRMCSEEHSIFNCSKMLEMAIPAHLQWAAESNVCLNCFSPSHATDKCASANRCKVCRKAHHTLIHQKFEGVVVEAYDSRRRRSGQ